MDEKQYMKDRVDNQFNYFDKKSIKSQRRYKTWRVVLILASVSIPFLTLMIDKFDFFKFIVAGVGVIIAAVEGFMGLNKYHEEWVNNRKTAESIKREKYMFLTKSGVYKEGNAFDTFVTRIENILNQESKDWESYMNASDGKK